MMRCGAIDQISKCSSTKGQGILGYQVWWSLVGPIHSCALKWEGGGLIGNCRLKWGGGGQDVRAGPQICGQALGPAHKRVPC